VWPGVSSAVTPGRKLGVAVKQAPVDPRVVEVDAVDPVALGIRMCAEAALALGALDVDRDLRVKQAQTAGVIVVQVRKVDPPDVAERDRVHRGRVLKRLSGAVGQDRRDRVAAVKAPVHQRIADQRRVISGITRRTLLMPRQLRTRRLAAQAALRRRVDAVSRRG
jgi:hypothetical protein